MMCAELAHWLLVPNNTHHNRTIEPIDTDDRDDIDKIATTKTKASITSPEATQLDKTVLLSWIGSGDVIEAQELVTAHRPLNGRHVTYVSC